VTRTVNGTGHGGTALAGLARRIACAKNPQIKHLNPCCIQDFCADHRTCEATATTCPLVLGIGRHETAMSRLVDVPCCAREWYLATVASFMRYTLKLSKPRGDEAVETELSSSNLCGALDFSKVDDVCGRLETRDVLLKKAAHDARCAHRGPGATPRIELSEGLFSRLRGA
jgi:hypothetical protein